MNRVWAGALATLVAGLWGCAADTPEVTPTSALDGDGYWFCHVPGAEAEQAQKWCDLLDDVPADRCAGLRATCEGVVSEGPPSGCDDGAVRGRADSLAQRPDPPPPPPTGCSDLDADGLVKLSRWIGAILVAALLFVVLRLIIGSIGRRFRPVQAPPAERPPESDPVLPDVPDLASGDLLTAAHKALEEGRTGEAVVLARGATLRHLGDRAKLRLHRARTDREYVRALRREPSAQHDLRDVVMAVEHHRWGGEPLAHDRAERALTAATRVLQMWVVLLAVLLGAAPASGQSAERYSPDGDAALLDVLQRYGYDAGWRLSNLAHLGDETDAVILDLSALIPLDEHWEAMRRWTEEGGVLVVAAPSDDAEGLGQMFPELGTWRRLDESLPVARSGALIGTGLPTPRWSDGGVRSVFDGAESWVVAVDPLRGPVGGAVVVTDVGLGVVVGIADPRLLWNASYVHPANEAFVGDLLYLGQGIRGWPIPTPARVQLATRGSLADPAADINNPLASMANARLALFVVQLLATWGLVGMWRGWPFATLRDPPEEGRLDFSDHVVALGTRWFRLGASRHALVQTARLWLDRLGTGGLQLAAQRAGKGRADAQAWVTDLEALVEQPGGHDEPSDLERMEELWMVTRRAP